MGDGTADVRAGKPSSSPRPKVARCELDSRGDRPRETSMGKAPMPTPSVPPDTMVGTTDQGSGTISPGGTLWNMRYAEPTATAMLPRAHHCTCMGVSWVFAVSRSSSLVIAMSETTKGFGRVAGINAKERRLAWNRLAAQKVCELVTHDRTESTYTFVYRTGRENTRRWVVIAQNGLAHCVSLRKHPRAAHSSKTLTFLAFESCHLHATWEARQMTLF